MKIDGFLFDLDGTLFLGEQALPGAVSTLAALRQSGKQVLFVSNKPLETRQQYADKLTRLGIPARPEDVLTSAFVLGQYLAKHHAGLTYYLVGESALRRELRGYGLSIVDELADQDAQEVIEPVGIEAVIVAFDRTLDYRKLNTAYQALVRGARFFATNADKACPMPGGAIPDAGATIAALEHLTGRKLELLAGKPSPLILQMALEILGLPAQRCLMTGDRLETDIRMGQEAGMQTALVLTGATRLEQARQSQAPPDFILENLGGLLNALGEAA
ncbi:MAG: HAD-IIA family hydrolase [Chloroflexota bacterium]